MINKMIFTLIFVKRKSEVLLGMKTRGVGVGYWNGFGGKVEPNENIVEGAQRELKEESNLEAHLKHVGVLTYEEENNSRQSVVHVFTANKFNGTIEPSEEMNPIEWYKFKDIPYEQMWPDSKYWYPIMLEDKHFSVFVKYDQDGKIREKNIKVYADMQGFLSYLNAG